MTQGIDAWEYCHLYRDQFDKEIAALIREREFERETYITDTLDGILSAYDSARKSSDRNHWRVKQLISCDFTNLEDAVVEMVDDCAALVRHDPIRIANLGAALGAIVPGTKVVEIDIIPDAVFLRATAPARVTDEQMRQALEAWAAYLGFADQMEGMVAFCLPGSTYNPRPDRLSHSVATRLAVGELNGFEHFSHGEEFVEQRLIAEQAEWVSENVLGRWQLSEDAIDFENEGDAALFKLRWS